MGTRRTLAAVLTLAMAPLAAARQVTAAAPAAGDGPPRSDGRGVIDRQIWSARLAALKDADWRSAFRTGQELAALPADQGFAILEENWQKIENDLARQQLLKAWYYSMPYPLQFRNHPRLLSALDLGARDSSLEVRFSAFEYLRWLVFRDFSNDIEAYCVWYEIHRDSPLTELVSESVRQIAVEARGLGGQEALQRARILAEGGRTFREIPEARQAALEAGLLLTLQRWAWSADSQASEQGNELAERALHVIGHLQLEQDQLSRFVVPFLAKENPADVRVAAMRAFEDRKHVWAVDVLLDVLKGCLVGREEDFRSTTWEAAMALGRIGEPKAIPVMIGVIDADNSYDTIYGIGWFGLNPLTGVDDSETHTGAWWRRWWEQNKQNYPPDVRAMEIPKLEKKLIPRDSLADVADVPALDLRAAGDEHERYFLIGAAEEASPPADGYGLLIVLPGGDGSADFNPFVRRIHKNVLNQRWLSVQLVAPKWDEKQFESLVWPTTTNRYPEVQFTTEEFIQAVLDDVRAKAKIDPQRIFLLGWSSGGPACYAAALRQGSPVTGAFVAMSVFKPDQLPALASAKGKAFYLLQSLDDQVTPLRFAEEAEKALRAAGAKVHLQRCEGGHGWHGDMWGMIREGVEWLEKEARESTD